MPKLLSCLSAAIAAFAYADGLGGVKAENDRGVLADQLVAKCPCGVDQHRYAGVGDKIIPGLQRQRAAVGCHRHDAIYFLPAYELARRVGGEQPGLRVDIGEHRRHPGAQHGGRRRDKGQCRQQYLCAARQAQGRQCQLQTERAIGHAAATGCGFAQQRTELLFETQYQGAVVGVPARRVHFAQVGDYLAMVWHVRQQQANGAHGVSGLLRNGPPVVSKTACNAPFGAGFQHITLKAVCSPPAPHQRP
jgi:hypothetical protein